TRRSSDLIANKVSPASIVYGVAVSSASTSSAGAALGASASTLRTSPGKIRSEVKLFNDLISLTDCAVPEEMLQRVSNDSTVISDADILAVATADKAVSDAAEIIVFFMFKASIVWE